MTLDLFALKFGLLAFWAMVWFGLVYQFVRGLEGDALSLMDLEVRVS